jgi:putative membrane protein
LWQASAWEWLSPLTLLTVLGLGLLARHWARRVLPGELLRLGIRQRFYLGAAWVSLYLGFGGPLSYLDRFLFSAHALQIMLLTMVAVPLGCLGVPPALAAQALTPSWARRLLAFLSKPLWAILLFTAALSLGVVPSLYDWTVSGPLPLFISHLVLTATALLLWWPVLSPVPGLPRLHPSVQLLYLFLAGIPMMLPQVLITLSSQPLYPVYAQVPRLYGLSQVADQQLGGGLMLLGMHLALGAAFVAAFAAWMRRERREGTLPTPPPTLSVIRPDSSERRVVRRKRG